MSFVHSPPDPPYALLTVDPSFPLQPAADRQFRTGRRRKRHDHTPRPSSASTLPRRATSNEPPPRVLRCRRTLSSTRGQCCARLPTTRPPHQHDSSPSTHGPF